MMIDDVDVGATDRSSDVGFLVVPGGRSRHRIPGHVAACEIAERSVPDPQRDAAHVLVGPVGAVRNLVEWGKSHLRFILLSGPDAIVHRDDPHLEGKLWVRMANLSDLRRAAGLGL